MADNWYWRSLEGKQNPQIEIAKVDSFSYTDGSQAEVIIIPRIEELKKIGIPLEKKRILYS